LISVVPQGRLACRRDTGLPVETGMRKSISVKVEKEDGKYERANRPFEAVG